MNIPLCIPHFNGRESEYVLDCIQSGWVSTVGSWVSRFEVALAEYTGARYAVAVNSGTAALHMALLVGGVGHGDEVLVPSLTFIATANAVRYTGAEPVFTDCDDEFGMDIDQVIGFLSTQEIRENGIWNRDSGKRIKAVIPVHLFGYAVDLSRLTRFCRNHNIIVVEDATESLGTFYLDEAKGRSSTGIQGDFGCFSFNGNKIITTGGGGMVVTSDDEYARALRHLTTQAKSDPIFYVHDQVGYNNRLTNIQGAMGMAQLEQIEHFIAQKQRHHRYYRELLADNESYELSRYPANLRSNHWFFALRLKHIQDADQRDVLLQRFFNAEIQVRPTWRPLHLQDPYVDNQTLGVEHSERIWETTLNLPCSVDLTEPEIERVVEVLTQ